MPNPWTFAPRAARPASRKPRPGRPVGCPQLEALEDRTLLTVSLVKDINLLPQSSIPAGIVNVGGKAFFEAYDPLHGRELWVSDGTDAGTHLVKDFNPGLNSSVERDTVAYNGMLYFISFDAVNGRQLWRSDGTDAGTAPILGLPVSAYGGLQVLGGLLYFAGIDAAGNVNLCRTDGTVQGTVELNTFGFPVGLAYLNGAAYFLTDQTGDGGQLWKTDGTPQGTVLVTDFGRPGPVGTPLPPPTNLTTVGGALYFNADTGPGTQLWKSDGTAGGTQLVKDIPNTAGSITAGRLTAVGQTLFFTAYDSVNGNQLWRSDGTADGTFIVPTNGPQNNDAGPGMLTAVGDTLFFGLIDGTSGPALWKADASGAATVLKDFGTAGTAGTVGPNWLTASGGVLYFENSAAGLWKSDGTAAGTVLVRPFTPVFAVPGQLLPNPLYPPTGQFRGLSYLADVNGTLFFAGPDAATGEQLWKSDGSAAGTVLVKDINPGTQGPGAQEVAPFGSKVLVAGVDNVTYRSPALWISDGTEAGTTQLADLRTTLSTSAVLGGRVFFAAAAGTGRDVGLWATDGTPAGTVLVKDIIPGGDALIESLVNVGGTLYFSATDGVHGRQLWKSDGTAAGTVSVADLNPAGDSAPADLVGFRDTLYFDATDGMHGRQLWKSDGTAAGTAVVKDIFPGGNAYVYGLTVAGGWFYFAANDGVTGEELWRSDGTANGTALVKDISAGGDSYPANFLAAGDTLFFAADDGVNGRELWSSDGTAAGTYMVKDINPTGSSLPHSLTASGGKVFFAATDGTPGNELWVSDGTAAGTLKLTDVPGFQDSGVAAAGGTVFFAGYSRQPGQGSELWASDGTAAGTRLAKLLAPVTGFRPNFPSTLVTAGGVVYFTADDLVHGRELWKAVAPQAGLKGPSGGTAGQPRTYTLSAAEPTVNDPSAAYTFTVDWGDGTTDTVTGPAGTRISHSFGAPGEYTVTLTAADADGLVSPPVTRTVHIDAGEFPDAVPTKGGTAGDDASVVLPGRNPGGATALQGGESFGTRPPGDGGVDLSGGSPDAAILVVVGNHYDPSAAALDAVPDDGGRADVGRSGPVPGVATGDPFADGSRTRPAVLIAGAVRHGSSLAALAGDARLDWIFSRLGGSGGDLLADLTPGEVVAWL